ncbi:MAG: hypothetical protein IT428_00435 [Planctomycetaceae bacterium]|nr:hypothetical protein [Planctomycetaceae bacterium]
MKIIRNHGCSGIHAALLACVSVWGAGCGASAGKTDGQGNPAANPGTGQPGISAAKADKGPRSPELQKLEAMQVQTGVFDKPRTNEEAKYLEFQGSAFKSTDFDLLVALPNVERLGFNNLRPPIGDAGLRKLLPLKKINYLDLQSQEITSEGLEVLKGFPELEHLYLAGNPIGDSGLPALEAIPKLNWLSLEYCGSVTDQGVPHLKKLTGLKVLALLKSGVSEAGRQELRAALPNCSVAP